jgi:hypothetical protein
MLSIITANAEGAAFMCAKETDTMQPHTITPLMARSIAEFLMSELIHNPLTDKAKNLNH